MSDSKDKDPDSIESGEDKTLIKPEQTDRTVISSNGQSRQPSESQLSRPEQMPDNRTSSPVHHTDDPAESSVTATDTDTGTATGTGTGSDWASSTLWASQPSPTIAVGAIVKNRFRLEDLLGEGGMGVVYRALDERKWEAGDRDPYVAIKIISEAFLNHPESLKALQRESRKTQQLPHKNIVAVYDFDREGNRAFMTMELLVGQSLKEVIRNHKRGLDPGFAIHIITGICQALAYAHSKGIVHSDLKPGNVFLTHDNIVKVFDFGLARAALDSATGDGEKTLFDAGTLGALTPAYASYEMLEFSEPVTQDDIYALACIAYELFTGRHPFDKTKATKAYEQGLHPKRIKFLNKRQWKGLEKGLAFKKQDRTQSVEAFYQDITAKPPIGHKIALGAVIVLIVAAVLLRDPIMNLYKNQREKIQAQYYIETIRSGNDAEISKIVSKIGLLGIESRRIVTLDTRMELFEYFDRQVNARFDPALQRFDYAGAQEILNLALSYYEDSNILNDLGEQLEAKKNNLLSSLTSRFNTYLQQGRILPDMEEEDVFNIMSKVRLVDPKNPLLYDKRLESTYVKETEKAIQNKDISRAENLVNRGTSLFKSNKALTNLKGQLENIGKAEKNRDEIASLEQVLTDLDSKLKDQKDISDSAHNLKRLRELEPDHSLINTTERIILNTLDSMLDHMLQDQQWQTAEQLVSAMDGLLDHITVRKLYEKIEKSQNRFEKRIGDILNQFNMAVEQNRLTSPPENNASELVSRLERIIPGDIRIQRCYTQIAKAYLTLSEKAKDEKNWDKARSFVEKAGQQKLDKAMQASIVSAKEVIDQAQEFYEKELLAQEKSIAQEEIEKFQKEQELREIKKQERIQALHQTFARELARMKMTEDSAGKVLAIIDNLSVLNPDDPLLTSGREQIVDVFIQHAGDLKNDGQVEKALETIQTGLKVMPKAEALVSIQTALKTQIEKDKENEKQRTLEAFRLAAEKLMGQPDISDVWLTEMQAIIRQASNIDANAGWIKDLKTRVSAKILAQAALKREKELFVQAWALLEKTSRFDKDHSGIEVERHLLKNAETAFNGRVEKEAKSAEIDGLKQTLLTMALNNEVEKSKQLLDELKNELSKDDPFLKTTAPNAISDVYLRLSEKRYEKDDIDGAIRFVKAGLEFNAGYSPLKQELKRLEEKSAEKSSKQVENTKKELLSLAGAGNIAKAKQLFLELKKDLPANDPFMTTQGPDAIGDAYVRSARGKTDQNDMNGALKMIQEGLSFNSNHAGLQIEQKRLQTLIDRQEIEKGKQAFMTLVQSDNIDAAENLYIDLKEKLPADDVFIIKTGPDELAQAFLRAAQRTAQKNDKPGAVKYLERGLKAKPGDPSLTKLMTEFQEPTKKGRECSSQLAGYGTKSRAACYDMISDTERGPLMIVVPGGNGLSPFAIGKYEISVGEFNAFRKAKGNADLLPGDANLPATGISLKEAQDYAFWLSSLTDENYHLPTLTEWIHSAKSTGDVNKGEYNCRLIQGDKIIKGQMLMDIRGGGQNKWGLKNHIGNAQEWVESASGILAAGGAYTDTMSKCDVSLTRDHSGNPDDITGFRLVREIEK
jgi:serine/threonine protein kinase